MVVWRVNDYNGLCVPFRFVNNERQQWRLFLLIMTREQWLHKFLIHLITIMNKMTLSIYYASNIFIIKCIAKYSRPEEDGSKMLFVLHRGSVYNTLLMHAAF